MIALLSLTVVVALTAPPPVSELTYASPPRAARPALERHKVTTFAPGARLFVASHDVNLRSAANADAKVLGKLSFGAPVTIIERGARESVGSRVDYWYRVRTAGSKRAPGKEGHVFGSTLTPFLSRANLDDDGGLETFSASWTWQHAATVRVFDDGAEAVRAEWRPGATWRGGRITKLLAHAESVAGVPLVELEVLIGDPDEDYKTYWRVFYAYRTPDVGPPSLDEVFSAYRNNEVATRVRFDAGSKSAEVQFLQGDVVTTSDRYSLTPPDRSPPVVEHRHDVECFVHVEELPPLLPSSKRTLEPQHIVETQALAGGGRVSVRHGGCVHYTQAWTLALPKIPTTARARLVAAKEALDPFEGAGPLLEALGRALEEGTFNEDGGFPCGDAVCAVEPGTLDDAPALVVSYDVPL